LVTIKVSPAFLPPIDEFEQEEGEENEDGMEFETEPRDILTSYKADLVDVRLIDSN